MTGDLPDYQKKIIVVTIAGDYPAETLVDMRKILGVALKAPTTEQCIPVSIEHQVLIDHMKILGESLKTPTENGCLPVSIEHNVKIDHRQILGVDLLSPTVAKCLPMSIENPAIAYDATNDRFKIDLEKISATDKITVIQDAKDRTVTGTVTAEQTDQTKLKATVTQASIARTVTGTVTAEQATAASLKGTVYQSDETQLKATVTQAAKDRTISSVDATATPLQISLTALTGNSAALLTPAAGKAIRIKFISLEHSADVDIGYRFGAAGTIWYLRITKGVYLSNLIGCNNQGAADAALYLNSSGATNVKGYILYSEV